MINEYISINKKYEDDLFNIIKKVIDEAIMETENICLNPVDSFIFINDKLVSFYKQMAIVNGIISNEKSFTNGHIKYLISERLFIRIDEYLEPIYCSVKNYISIKANEVLESSTLGEMQEKYNSLILLSNNKAIKENSFLYDDIELKKSNDLTLNF